ncbi:MAG: PH domain-containing protein [Prevotella sp.]|jgi:hypothetical protein
MQRTFHHRFTLGAKCALLLCGAGAFYLFWMRAVLLGLVVCIIFIMIMERVLHSEYIIDNGSLLIRRGRFAKDTLVALTDIQHCRLMRTNFGLSRFLVLETRQGRLLMVEPENEQAFIDYIRKQQNAAEEPTSHE